MVLRDRRHRRAPSQAGAAFPPPAPAARFAVLDVETTGLEPQRERILELAIVHADERGRELGRWSTRIDPGVPVRATHIHGITDADVAGAPRFSDLAISIGTALQDLVLVAHNAEFDVEFLRAEFARAGLPMPRFSTYCTLQGSTLYLPQLRRRTLAECCAALGVTHQRAHSALGDAAATAGLLERFLALDARTGYDVPLTATRALRAATPAEQRGQSAGEPRIAENGSPAGCRRSGPRRRAACRRLRQVTCRPPAAAQAPATAPQRR